MTVNDKFDGATNCPVSPKNKQLLLDEVDIMTSCSQSSNSPSTKHDKNYYYSRLSQFRFPNDVTKSSSSENTLLGSPFKPTSTTPSSPQSTPSTHNHSQSIPRYTPSHSFQSQSTTPSRRSSHKRSVAISISSSSIDSVFSDFSKPSSLDSDTRSRISSVGSYSSVDHPMFTKKMDFTTGSKSGKHSRTPSFNYHQCHASSLPLPLIDLDLASKDPKPRTLGSFSTKKHNVFNFFSEDDTIVEDQAAEASSSSTHSKSTVAEAKPYQQCLVQDLDGPEIKGDSDEYVDLVGFLKETTVRETLEECEMDVKSKFEKMKIGEDYNPFQYIQSGEKWAQSPLCTPTVSR